MSKLREAGATIPSTTKISGYGSRRSPGRRSRVVSQSAVCSEQLSPARGLARSRPFRGIFLAGRGRLLRGARSRRGRPPCRCLAAARSADPAAAFRGHVGVGNAAAGAALVAAAGLLVDGCPCAPLGFLLADAAFLVPFLDVFGLALLLVAVAGFIAARHGCLPFMARLPNLATRGDAPGFRQTRCW